MAQSSSSQRQLSAPDIDNARKYMAAAKENLSQLSKLVSGITGNQAAAIRFKIGPKDIAKTDVSLFVADWQHPDVVIFEDENGNCLGMYIDPPGICTDEC
ncbi:MULTISPECIES: hypothetical protein [unclassified Mesorhizobium]|uniref:hypothetical protein n=1 Tax=unclassified Mesorhizobium TaxID=325217 RepID=UPI0012E36E61|nr:MULTISPECIES: hypothetical protein [unclassified Mesorhizobium]MDR7033286.1 hypothetical protein [Mesorhizobium sp. BE184]